MDRSPASDERRPLLPRDVADSESNGNHGRRPSQFKSELEAADRIVGERLPYNDYATIDWLRDLTKETRAIHQRHARRGLRGGVRARLGAAQGWIVAGVSGLLTAVVAYSVDVAEATVSDWKFGYCATGVWRSRTSCCIVDVTESTMGDPSLEPTCAAWQSWSSTYLQTGAIYTGLALLFGLISVGLTITTKSHMPTSGPVSKPNALLSSASTPGKTIYLAAGSGIPEIKTILSGFNIPDILGLRVLAVKAVGAVFAVGSGLCLGKEGPFVHISTCVAYLVCQFFPKYRDNDRKLREMLSAGCAAGIAVAFGAPIGGVLFSYEEISTFFPRRVLLRAFLCSLAAAVLLKSLNPTGDGKLVLFETSYGVSYQPSHYLVFAVLGVAGGCFGGAFCRLNFLWSGWFRAFTVIKQHPALEIALVVLATSLLQFPNPIAREPGDHVIKALLHDCRKGTDAWICEQEASAHARYVGWLLHGTVAKLVLTIITFGCKVPSGVIIPAMDAGAFFGRLIGQTIHTISPGIFAMVGAAAFLAGVSRMTISLCVVMFELTGEVEYIVPNMIAILIAKWVADACEPSGVYDLAQHVLGHPFLDGDHAVALAQQTGETAAALIPPPQTMDEITVDVPPSGCVPQSVLEHKLSLLQRRGLIDAGLVLVQRQELKGYLVENELDVGLQALPPSDTDGPVRLLGRAAMDDPYDLSHFVNRCPLTLSASAPVEYVAEMFTKLGLRYLCLVEEGSNRLVGVGGLRFRCASLTQQVVIKKRLIAWLESHRPSHTK